MENKSKVLFLQSWYSNVTDVWYPWLKEEVEKKGYKAYFPDIPEMRKDVPDMNKILKYIESFSKLKNWKIYEDQDLRTHLTLTRLLKLQCIVVQSCSRSSPIIRPAGI